MPCRLYLDAPLQAGAELALPPDTARHVQVLRLQPGDAITLFNGQGGEWAAEVLSMGRKDVSVRVTAPLPMDPPRELALHVTLAIGMPANERMDALVEKATELGAAALQPLHCARSVLRLSGERADKRRAHWQGVAVAASEQSGRTQVPSVAPVSDLARWLAGLAPVDAITNATAAADGDARELRGMLSLAPDAQPLGVLLDTRAANSAPSTTATGTPLARITLLSGPEGGLAPEEEALARAAGFVPLSLGPRVLRADTAPLAALAVIGVR